MGNKEKYKKPGWPCSGCRILDLKFPRATSLSGHMTASLTRLCRAVWSADCLPEGC